MLRTSCLHSSIPTQVGTFSRRLFNLLWYFIDMRTLSKVESSSLTESPSADSKLEAQSPRSRTTPLCGSFAFFQPLHDNRLALSLSLHTLATSPATNNIQFPPCSNPNWPFEACQVIAAYLSFL